MKKATIFLPLLMLFGFLLTACETNEPKVPDSVRQSIKGNYSGQVGMVSIGNKRDTIRRRHGSGERYQYATNED